MAIFRDIYVNMIHHVNFNRDDTISLYEQPGECLLRLPRAALDWMIELHENILIDLCEANEGGTYWYRPGIEIYSWAYPVHGQFTNDYHRGNLKKRLCIKQFPYRVIFCSKTFQYLILTANILQRQMRENCIHRLNKIKTIKFNVFNSTFMIDHENRDVSLVLPITALAVMSVYERDILKDLQSANDRGYSYYYKDYDCEIRSEPAGNYRLLMFRNPRDDSTIFITESTFSKMLEIAFNGSITTAEMREFRNQYLDGIPINTDKSIKFSNDNQQFTLIEKSNFVALDLPLSALDAMLSDENQISSDLQTPCDRDYINKYWSNGRYNLHTGVFTNSRQRINVVRFAESATNTFKFVMQEKAFRELLNIYRNYKH